MHIQTIEMDPRIARVHYADYRKKVREHREERKKQLDALAKSAGQEMRRVQIAKTRIEKEDNELLVAYRALYHGQRILNLYTVMHTAGVRPGTHFPVLAIAKANTETVYLHVNRWHDNVSFSDDRWRAQKRDVRVPRDRFPAEMWNTDWRTQQKLQGFPVKAAVPAVPPHLRPSNLGDYYILWEVPAWEPVDRTMTAPGDPFLLKRLSDSLFAVVAVWDLTPVEQAILEGRAV